MSSLNLTIRGLSEEDASGPRHQYFKILSDYLEPESSIDPQDVARAIDDLCPLKKDAEDAASAEDFVWAFWDDVIQIACQIPHDHNSQDRLLKAIQALQELPPTTVNFWVSSLFLVGSPHL